MIIALSPCPTGWDFDPKEAIAIGKLAVKTGVWPLKEYVDGKVVHTKSPAIDCRRRVFKNAGTLCPFVLACP